MKWIFNDADKVWELWATSPEYRLVGFSREPPTWGKISSW